MDGTSPISLCQGRSPNTQHLSGLAKGEAPRVENPRVTPKEAKAKGTKKWLQISSPRCSPALPWLLLQRLSVFPSTAAAMETTYF